MALAVKPLSCADNDIIPVGDGLHAYLTGQEAANNRFQVGGVDTKIVEDFQPPAKLEADAWFKKDVKVENFGVTPAFIRLKAAFTDSDIEELCVVDWNAYDAEVNPNGWIYNEDDGYWYYPHVLEPGDVTTSLFTQVSIPNRDMNGDGAVDEATDAAIINTLMKDFDIIVYQEAYQALRNDGNPEIDEKGYFINYQDAWELYKANKPQEQASGYAIAYYANNTSAIGSMSVSTHQAGDGSKLNANAFAVDGYTFIGWNTKKDGSGIACSDEAVADLDVEENAVLNLYAQWRKIEITFSIDGTECRAENGMTWEQWFASNKYDTDAFIGTNINDIDNNEVSLNAPIIDGASYTSVDMSWDAS
jgi:uncharacterized repeat protein (TIGR02543 family)